MEKIRLLTLVLFDLIIHFLLKFKRKKREKSICIIKIDGLGDYILFRNMIEIIKNDIKYSDYKIYFIGFNLYKELAEYLDGKLVDYFIWIDRDKFYKSLFYRMTIALKLNKVKHELLISPTLSREIVYSDSLVLYSSSIAKIGFVPNDISKISLRRVIGNKYYTKLIKTKNMVDFEFNNNKFFIESIFGLKLNLLKPRIDKSNISDTINLIEGKYIILFLGAASKLRMWNCVNFNQLIKLFIKKYPTYKIVLSAATSDKINIEKLLFGLEKNKNIINLIGKLTLLELLNIVSNASLIVVGDTGVKHIASAMDIPGICLSNGNHFSRFVPYPYECKNNFRYLFPKEMSDWKDKYEFYKYKYNIECISNLDINSIRPEAIMQEIDSLLNEKKD